MSAWAQGAVPSCGWLRHTPRRVMTAVAGGVFLWIAGSFPAASAQDEPAPDPSTADATKSAPSGDVPASAPRSRLTIRGEYTVDTFDQHMFALGAGGDVEEGGATDHNAFWAQNLMLRPRFILTDDLNLNLSLDIAQGLWGYDGTTLAPGTASFYSRNSDLSTVHLDWAYVAYRHQGSQTRWYLGRQRFALGHLLVLDHDAAGLQVYRDFTGLNGSLAFGYAKESESGSISDENLTRRTDGRLGPDRRDADLFYGEWRSESPRFMLNPFLVYYIDRSNANGTTLVSDRLPYLEARFRPQVTRATALGLSAAVRFGALLFSAEIDQLSGNDRIQNADSGLLQQHDVNNGDLSGSNLYLRAAFVASRFEIGGVFAQGSGDEDPRGGEGNLNRVRTDGRFFITEIWDDSLMPDQGFFPDGLGSPDLRGYRELENTRILQGFLNVKLRQNLDVGTTFSLIRASEPIREWSDANSDGVISTDEFGPYVSDQLGSEMDARIDWGIGHDVLLTLRGGLFFPRDAASLLFYGTGRYQEAARELHLGVRVPISEFSLGG